MKLKWKRIFWGIFFIAAAVLVILGKSEALARFGVLRLVLGLLFIPVIIESAARLRFYGVFFPSALLLILFDRQLGIEELTPWPVLLAALLLSMGFTMIFRPFRMQSCKRKKISGCISGTPPQSAEGDNICISESFGASSKHINASALRTARFRCKFGSLKVYFNDAKLHPDGAAAYFDCSFSGVELYIPKDWPVIIDIDAVMGGVDEKNSHTPDSGMPALTLSGSISLGGLIITYTDTDTL